MPPKPTFNLNFKQTLFFKKLRKKIFKSKTKIFPVLLLFLFILGLVAVVSLLSQNQDLRQQASTTQPLCSNYKNTGSCGAVPGCYWDDTFSCVGKGKTVCQGLDRVGCTWSGEQNCSGKNEADCNNAKACSSNRPSCNDSDCNAGKSGCKWSGGNKIDCSLTDNNCSQPGCVVTGQGCSGGTYTVTPGYCSGRTGCSSFDDGECQFMNCVWNPPVTNNCSNITSSSSCNSKSNCSWQQASCSGKYTTPSSCGGSYYAGCSGGTYGGRCSGQYTDITNGVCKGTPIAPTATTAPQTTVAPTKQQAKPSGAPDPTQSTNQTKTCTKKSPSYSEARGGCVIKIEKNI